MNSFDFDSIYGSKYLSAADIKKPTIATVTDIELAAFTKPGEMSRKRAVLHFRNIDKPLVLNKTNATTLDRLFGKEPQNWIGESVVLKTETVLFGHKMVPAIRVHALPGKAPERAAEPAPPDPDDEISF